MKLSRIGPVVAAALCVAPAVHAEQHGATYATVKAVVDYCERVDEQHRAQYAQFGDMALASISSASDTGNYGVTYDAVSDALRQIPPNSGRANCAAGIGAPSGTGTGERDRDDHDDHRGR